MQFQFPLPLQPQLSKAERADMRPREGEDLVRYFQRIGLPRARERGYDPFAPALPDFSSTISPGERYLYARDGDPMSVEHDMYQANVDKVLDIPLVPRRWVEVQLGLGSKERSDQVLAEKLGDYEGGDLTPRQYLQLTPAIQRNSALLAGDYDAYLQLAEAAKKPGYVDYVVEGAIQRLKATGGKRGPAESEFAVGSLINAIERGAPDGEYADEASVTEAEWQKNLEAGGRARYALLTEGARQNAKRKVAGEFLRAMQDGDLRPKDATWVSSAITNASAAIGDLPALERAQIEFRNSPFVYRSFTANELLRNSQLLAGGPRSLVQNGAMAMDKPYVWDGIAEVMSRNPQYPAAGAVQPANSFLTNLGTILNEPAKDFVDTSGSFAYMDNRFNRTQPLRPNNQTPAQSDQDRLEALRYNQGMRGYYGAAFEPYTNAGWNTMRRIVGLEEKPREFPWRITEMAVSMPDAFKSNVYSLAALGVPTLAAGARVGGMAGMAQAATRLPYVMGAEVVDELKEDFGNDILETGSLFDSTRSLFTSPQANAYARTPGKGLLGREMFPNHPSEEGYDEKKKEAQQYYQGVLERQRQTYRNRGK